MYGELAGWLERRWRAQHGARRHGGSGARRAREARLAAARMRALEDEAAAEQAGETAVCVVARHSQLARRQVLALAPLSTLQRTHCVTGRASSDAGAPL